MRTLFAFAILLVASALAAPPPPHAPEELLKIPQKCDDVLSVKVCDKLTTAAANLKLKADIVKEAVVDAVKKGKKTTEEIIASVEKFYLEKVKTKQCTDFVSADTCKKLSDIATKLKIKSDEFETFVKKALIQGKSKAVEVYNRVVEYYINNVKGKSCEELLSKTPELCSKLRKVSTSLKIKAEQFKKIVTEAVIEGYTNTKEFVKKGIQKLKDHAANFSCEELLNPGLCTKLREYSAKMKVAFPKIMSTVRDLLVKGVNVAKGFLNVVYKITDAFIDCEDIFEADSCKLIKEKVTAIGGTISDIGKTVREFATKGINKAKDIYNKVLEFTKSKILCKYLKLACPKLPSSLIEKRSLGLKDLLQKYKEMLKKGIADAKAKLKSSLDSLMDSMKIMDKTVRDIMKQAIDDGKMKYSELKALLKKLVDVATGKTTNGTDTAKPKRDLKEKLSSALKTAHAHLKTAIEYLLTKSKEELKKMHNYVSQLLKKILGDGKSRREIGEIELMEQFADAAVEDDTRRLTLEAEQIADELLDNAVEELEEDVVETSIEKRDLTSAIDKAKQVFGKIGDKLKDALSKLRSTSIEDIKAALKKAGVKLIGVAEDVYNKIKAALEKQSTF